MRNASGQFVPWVPASADAQLILDALDALRGNTTIEGELLQEEPLVCGRNQADAVIELVHEDRRTLYLVECKAMIDRKQQIDQVHRQLTEFDDKQGMLIAPYLSRQLAQYCRMVGLQFIDACGNAYLRTPGLFVFIAGEKNGDRRPVLRQRGLTNAAGLRVVFALLTNPKLLQASLQQIADYGGVSVGAVHGVLVDLEARGYLINRSIAAKRRLLEPQRLVEEWAINYPTTLRTKLHSRRFRAPDAQWWSHCHDPGLGIAWGGEVAASKMTNYLKPATQTLYVPPARMDHVFKKLVVQYRLRPDPAGDIEILEQFWHAEPAGDGELAPPLLVYSELLALLDPRATETAHMIKEQYIDPTFDSP